jgi:regulator of protease activity HflC (stomatin/prohibitin superfamily)
MIDLGECKMEKQNEYIDNGYDDWIKRVFKIVRWSIIALILFIMLLSIPYTVKAGERGVVLTWGKVDMTAKSAGLHAKIPIAQTVERMSVQTMKYDAEASSASKDLQIVHATIAVNYHLLPEEVPKLYKDIGMSYESKIIQPAVQEVVKASTAQFTAEELITKRGDVKVKIDDLLRERLADKGIILETTSITNFDFSEEFNKAIEQKVTAQQIALKAENDLTRIKIEKEQAITQAEAIAQSTKLKADAEAYSLQVIREQLEKNNALIQYKSIEKWNGVTPVYMMGSSVPFVQLPSMIANNT